MTTPIFASVVRRLEDPRFLAGPRATRTTSGSRARFVRSIMAHVRVLGIGVTEAVR